MIFRASAWVVAALVLAGWAWRDAAQTYFAARAPERAPAFLQRDPQLAFAAKIAALPAGGQATPNDAAVVEDLARAALQRSPLLPTVLRDLALTSERAGQPGFESRLGLAERTSRRDMATQNALVRLAAFDDDYEGALTHLDRLLTVSPQAHATFIKAMAGLVSFPEARTTLARYDQRRWFLPFALDSVDRVENPRELAELLQAAEIPPSEQRSLLSSRLLERILATGDYRAARAFALGFGHASPAALDDFRLRPATAQRDWQPLSWRLGSDTGTQVGLNQAGRMLAEISSGAGAVVAERVTLLPAGRYILEQRLAENTGGGDLRLEWSVTCRDHGTAPFWKQSFPIAAKAARHRSVVVVPDDCPAQHWQLQAARFETQTNASFSLDLLSLTPG